MLHFRFFAVLIALVVFCGCERYEPNNGAPATAFGARQAWGKREFGSHWGHVNDWINSSKLISESIGEIKNVAPVGRPNEMFNGFGEAWADMNLELVGSKGKGVLFLNSFCLDWNKEGFTYRFHDGTFEFGDRKEIICTSGKGYLEEFGLDEMYSKLLNYSADEDPDVFLQTWKLLQKVVSMELSDYQSPVGQAPMQGLQIYREPLLAKRAELLDGWGLAEEGAVAHLDVAQPCLKIAAKELRSDSPDRQLVAKQLDVALQSLRSAYRLQPDNQEVLKQARQRVCLYHKLKISAQTSLPKERQSVFYEAALHEVKSIAFLNRKLGKFSVCPDSSHFTGLRISKDNRYSDTVYLDLDGRWDDGTVCFRYWENDELPPIDLFAENPRQPDYPLVFKSPRWKSKSGERVKLSAKTGEPMQQKKVGKKAR